MAKKLTRKEKEELSKKGICWKCGSKRVSIVNWTVICPDCGLKVTKYC